MALYIVPMKATRLLEASTRNSTILGFGRFLKSTFFMDFIPSLTIFSDFLANVSFLFQ